jgi:hypothetical protein
VITRVSQPPSVNFWITVTTRISTHSAAAITCAGRWRAHDGSSRRRRNQNTVIAMFDSENVTNTLIAYMTTNFDTWPRV